LGSVVGGQVISKGFVDAGTNKQDEIDELGTIADDRDAAEDDYNTANGEIGNLEGLYNLAKAESDEAEDITARRLIMKDDA
jgi:hypothetical protein